MRTQDRSKPTLRRAALLLRCLSARCGSALVALLHDPACHNRHTHLPLSTHNCECASDQRQVCGAGKSTRHTCYEWGGPGRLCWYCCCTSMCVRVCASAACCWVRVTCIERSAFQLYLDYRETTDRFYGCGTTFEPILDQLADFLCRSAQLSYALAFFSCTPRNARATRPV